MPTHRPAFGSGQRVPPRAGLLNIILVSVIEYLTFKSVFSQFSQGFTINAYAILGMI